MPKISYIVNQAPVIPVSLSFDGFNPGFRLVRARRLRRRIYYLARSESCASVRELRIRILSGCVRGFSVPENRIISTRKCAFDYFYCLGLACFAKA